MKNNPGNSKRVDLCNNTAETTFAHYSKISISYLCLKRNKLNPYILGALTRVLNAWQNV